MFRDDHPIARIQGLDEFAQLLFSGNRSHQQVFLAILIELKYAPGQFLPHLSSVCDRYGLSPRMLETLWGKMRRLELIDHVSRFNKGFGYREGWVFSNRFSRTMARLGGLTSDFRERRNARQEKKDRDLFMYV